MLRVRAIDEACQAGGHALAVFINPKGSIEGWSVGSPIGRSRETIILTHKLHAACLGVHRFYIVGDREYQTLFTVCGENSRHYHIDHGDLP